MRAWEMRRHVGFITCSAVIALFWGSTVAGTVDAAWAAGGYDITIQAEDYDRGGQHVAYFDKTPGNAGGQYRTDDVDIWKYGASTYYVGANATGEWLNYTIDVPYDGYYRFEISAATSAINRRIRIEVDGVDKTGSLIVPNLVGWTKWRTCEATLGLNAGRRTLRLVIEAGGLNVDWMSLSYLDDIEEVSAPSIDPDGGTFMGSVAVTLASATPNVNINYTLDGSAPFFSPTSQYYTGPFTLTRDTVVRAVARVYGPGGLFDSSESAANFVIEQASEIKVEAEDYDQGGQRVGYYDKTPGNAGRQYRFDDVDIWRYGPVSCYTGANASGEWLKYTIDVPETGNYRLDIRLSTPYSNRKVHVDFDDVDETGSLVLPTTGGWTSWRTFSTNVALGAGPHVMRVAVDEGGLNLDWIALTFIGDEWVWYGHAAIEDEDDLLRLSGYTSVSGNLTIFQTGLSGLGALSDLTSVGGSLTINYNPNLERLDGLERLTSVGGSLSIVGNDTLTALSALNSLARVGGNLDIGNNPNLTTLHGLNNLTVVGRGLTLMVNANLINLEGLNRLTTVGGSLMLDGNTKLESLAALSSLGAVGGSVTIYGSHGFTNLNGLETLTTIAGSLSIVSIAGLESLDGLNHLTSLGGGLEISDNPRIDSLSELDGLTFIGGALAIHNNATLTALFLTDLAHIGGPFIICDNPMLDQALVHQLRDQVLGREGIGGIVNIGPTCR